MSTPVHVRLDTSPKSLCHSLTGVLLQIPKALRADLTAANITTGRSRAFTDVTATDGTRKLLRQLHDGRVVETVGIPSDYSDKPRLTACVSSQVCCNLHTPAMRCCHTLILFSACLVLKFFRVTLECFPRHLAQPFVYTVAGQATHGRSVELPLPTPRCYTVNCSASATYSFLCDS